MFMWKKRNQEPSLDDFKSNKWNNLSSEERKDRLQYLEDTMANECGRPSRNIEIHPELPVDECGYYDVDYPDKIFINDKYLHSNDPFEKYDAMDTVIHEGRHAYQDDCINGRIAHSESKEKVDTWHRNFDVYNSVDRDHYQSTYTSYRFQPIEDDANNFSNSKMESFSNLSNDPEYQSYLEVKNRQDNHYERNAMRQFGPNYKDEIRNHINARYDLKHSKSDVSDKNKDSNSVKDLNNQNYSNDKQESNDSKVNVTNHTKENGKSNSGNDLSSNRDTVEKDSHRGADVVQDNKTAINEDKNTQLRGTIPEIGQNESNIKNESIPRGSKPIENQEINRDQNKNELNGGSRGMLPNTRDNVPKLNQNENVNIPNWNKTSDNNRDINNSLKDNTSQNNGMGM